MKKIVKHSIGFLFMVFGLYTLTTLVSYIPVSDAVKGAVLLVVLAVVVVVEIAVSRRKKHEKKQDS